MITQKIKNDHQEGMKRSIRPEIFPVVIPIIVHRFLKQIDSFLSIDCKSVKQCKSYAAYVVHENSPAKFVGNHSRYCASNDKGYKSH